MRPAPPRCPHCGSRRTLPFEKEEDYRSDESPEVAVYAGVTLVTLAIGLFLAGLLAYRILLVPALLTLLFWLRRRWQRGPGRPRGDFVCLDCSRFFRR